MQQLALQARTVSSAQPGMALEVMMADIGGVLDKLGFSSYKKKVYLALLRLGESGAVQLAKKSGVPSSRIYEVLDWLQENGYVSLVGERPLVYKANDPKHVLRSDVRSRMAELREVDAEISRLGAGLALGGAGSARFEVVKGRDAFFKKVKQAVASSEKSIVAIVKNWRLDYELRSLTSEFVGRGGRARFLGPVAKENRQLVAEWKKMGVDVKRFLPDTTRFTVWDGRTVAIGFKEEGKDYLSLWIENEYLGRILVQHFENAWKNA
jgi:sugar-specific transcriptional regulator TrmB